MANLFLYCSCPFDLWGSEIATVFTAIVYRVEYQSCISSRWCLSLVQSCKSVTIIDCKALVMKDCIHRGVKFLLSHNQTDFHEHLPVYQHLDQLVCVFAMCSGIPTVHQCTKRFSTSLLNLTPKVVSVATWLLFHYTRMFSPDVLI